MTGCRYWRRGECRLVRHGRRPSAGVCRACESAGSNRILGLGDVVRLALSVVPMLESARACGGCRRRQERLNRLAPAPGLRGPVGTSEPADGAIAAKQAGSPERAAGARPGPGRMSP